MSNKTDNQAASLLASMGLGSGNGGGGGGGGNGGAGSMGSGNSVDLTAGPSRAEASVAAYGGAFGDINMGGDESALPKWVVWAGLALLAAMYIKHRKG